MKKIENVYTLKPNYDDPTPQRKTYTGTWMPVEEYWQLLNDYLGDLDTANGFRIDDPYHFSMEADRLWPVTICFLHPEIEGIVGEKTISEEELYELLNKLQDEDCEESEEGEEDEDEEDEE